MARKKADPAPEPVAVAEIQPGEAVDIRLTRLESGDWCASIGAVDGEDALAHTALWPFEALRGLGKLVKERAGELAAYRLAGEQEMGRCPHVSGDGADCCAMDCRVSNVPTLISTLRLAAKAAPEREDHLYHEDGPLSGVRSDFVRIVALHGKLEKPRLIGEGDEDELTTTVKVSGRMRKEYEALKPHANSHLTVVVFGRHVESHPDPEPTSFRPTQPELFRDPEPVSIEVLACPQCQEIVRGEGFEPGNKCPFCEFGTLEIRKMLDLICAACGKPADRLDAKIGDTCSQCEAGQYAISHQGGSMPDDQCKQEECEKEQAPVTETEGEAEKQPETGKGGGAESPEGGEAEGEGEASGEEPSEA